MAASELKIAGMKLMIEGGAQFQSDLNTAKTTSKMLTSELKLLEAGTTLAGKNGVEFLRAKSESLSAQLAKQEQVTKINKIALQEAANATEVDAKQVQRLENEVLKSQIAEEKLKVSLVGVTEQMNKATDSALQHGIAQKEMGEKAKAAGDKLSSAGSSMTMMLTVPIAAAGVAAIKLASDYEESLNKINVAYKDNAAEVITWSNTTLKNLGLAKGTALDMAAKYGDMATGMGLSTAEAAKLGQELVGRAADLASFKNVSIDIANTALTGVFTGEGESLKQLGIVMLDANLAQYALANGHKTAWKEMETSEKVLVRAAYVMDMSKNSAGDFARTIDGTANQSRLFAESLKELAQTFGKDLLPVITPVIKGANDMIQSFGELDVEQRKIVVGIALAVAATGPLLTVVGNGIALWGSATAAIGAHTIALANMTAAQIVARAELAATLLAILPLAAAIGATAVAANTYDTAMNAATKSARATTDACNESAKAFNEQTDGIKAESAVTQTLSDKLFDLSKKENKSNTEKSQMSTLVKQLNDRMPELSLSIDAQTGALSKNKTEVDGLIKSSAAFLKQQAEETRLSGLFLEQITLAEDLTKANEDLAAAKKALADENGLEKWLSTATGNLNVYGRAVVGAQAAVDLLTVAQVENTNNIAGNTAATESYVDSFMKTAGTIVKTNVKTVESVKLTAEETAAALKKEEESLKERQAATEQYYDDLQKSFEDHLSEMGSLEAEGIERSELTAAKLKENRDQQVKDYQDWREGLKLIAELIPGDVLAELEKLGPKYDQIIDDLAKMTPEQIAAWVESYRAPAEEAAKAAGEEMGKLPEIAAGAIVSTTAKFQETALMEAAAREAGRKTTAAYVAGLKIQPAGSKDDYYSRLAGAFASGKLPSYDVGTKYVTRDQLALIHKGEAVIPASENPYNPARSLGGEATSRAMSNYGASQSNTVNNLSTDASVAISMAGAIFNVRSDGDIDAIASALALKVVSARKAVGA